MDPDYYESDRAVSEYLLFHYGTREQVVPYAFGPTDALEYPARCVRECVDTARLGDGAAGLDLGCAVGRSTFELARWCGRVVGIDFSERFVAIARHLAAQGSITYGIVEEGLLSVPATALVPEAIDRGRVTFERGDAQALRADLGVFDVVLMANLIDRLREPARCLVRLKELVKPGGQLVVTSPYTWLETHTPREHWLGGFERGGARVRTLDALGRALEPDFRLERVKDLPFLIREHARKFQWSVAQGSVWIRA